MRYPASEKLEVIRIVEQSHLPARRTLAQIGISRATFYRWYDQYRSGGPETLHERPCRPDRVWNRIPDEIRTWIIDLVLEAPELSPRELAVRFTDSQSYFVSEASVYRLLKAGCFRACCVSDLEAEHVTAIERGRDFNPSTPKTLLAVSRY